MAGEQLIIDRPSQEFLHAVLKHPDLPKLASAPTFEPPEKSTLTLSASPELRGYPLDSISVIDKYLQKCVELGVRPYYGVLLK
jgi:hypothetical protein